MTEAASARRPFTYVSLPMRVLFDVAAADAVAAEADRLQAERLLLVRSPGKRSASQSAALADRLGERLAASFDEAKVHVPVETLEACLLAHKAAGADAIVAIGGGSAIGLGKLVAGATRTPLVAVPTTYSGAEMTPFNAVTENGQKVQRRDAAMLPTCVVYDPDFTAGLPMAVAGPSMMNAVAHAVEGMYAPDTNPVIQLKADLAIRLAAAALPRFAKDAGERAARRDLMLSAMLAGEVLAVTSMALHHKLCHLLGGGFDLPHADVNAVILPYAMAYNAAGAPEIADRIAGALGRSDRDAAGGLFDLAREGQSPASLAALGLPEEALATVARTAARQSYPNPVPLEEAKLRALLDDAWAGRRPVAYAAGA